jgi:Carboxypeptidase regulatory-like domain
MSKGLCRLRRWAAVPFAVAMVVCLAGRTSAQTQATTARIIGVVSDNTGAVLPGATVGAKNQATGLNSSTVTDGRGFYRIINLPPGTYSVTASLQGFGTVTQTDVHLLLGSSASVDFKLELAKVAETVTVTSEVPLVEPANTAASYTIQTEQLKYLPISGRNFTNLVQAMPETTTSDERGYLALSGQRGINTSIMVDGVDDNNPFFGGAIGQAENRAPLQISEESIKEFSVTTNGASAEMGRSGGGFINVITKSGTNEFHGSALYYKQPQSLIATRADGVKPQDQKKDQYGASLGGPFMKDKLFFFVSYDKQKQDITQPITPLGYDPAVAAKYPYFASAENFVQTDDGQVLFGRMDYQFNGANRLTARANYADYTGDNGTSSASYNATGHNGIERMLARSYVASYSGAYGNNWINDTNLEYVIEDTPRLAKNNQYPEIQVYGGGADFGGISYLPINPTKVTRKMVGDTVTYMWGDHVFKAGGEYNDTGVNQVFKGNWRGVYRFNSQADFLAGKWSQFYQFGGLGGLTADEAGRANFSQKELAFFIQDQWFITPNMTATFGLRWEGLDNPNGPILNPEDRNANGSMNLNGQIPDDNKQWSPRLGMTWSPGNTGKTVLRASLGRFYSRTPGLLWAQTFTSNGTRGTQYTVYTSGGNPPTDPLAPGWGADFDPTILSPIDFSGIATPTGLGVFTVSPNFRNPYTDRVTIGADHEIAAETAVSLDVTYARGHNLERLTDINLQYDIDPATGLPKLSPINGQPMFSRTRPDSYYGRITEYVSDAESKYVGVVLAFNRRFTEHFTSFASVTWSRDRDTDSNERNYAGVQAEDVLHEQADWGYSVRDQRWKINLTGVWNTPWWGITFSGVYSYRTGSPFNATTSSDANGDGFYNDRPTIGGVHFERNSFRYPDYQALSLRVQKDFAVGPGNASVIVECFNCANVANYSVLSTQWGNGQTPASNFDKQGTPSSFVRTFQLAVRYDF